MNSRSRLPWLDWARLISTFLVILFHTPPRLALLDDAVILNMRMPVFFFVSGLLYGADRYNGHFIEYARRRCRQILVPYVSFTLFFYVLWLAVGRRLGGPEEMAIAWWRPLVETVTGNPSTVVAPFWFIACLLPMQLIYYWLYRYVPWRWLLPLSIAVALLSRLLPGVSFWNLSNVMLYMPFYVAGNVLCSRILPSGIERPRQGEILRATCYVLPAILAAAAIGAMVWAVVSLDKYSVGFAAVRIASGLALLPAFFGVARWLARRFGRRQVVENVVLCGTVYLAMQNYAIGVFKLLIIKFGGEPIFLTHPLAIKVAIAVVVMIAIYPVAVLILRRAPWLAGR